MKKLSFDEAKKLFFEYNGSKMDIEHDLGDVYNDCKIPWDVELQWLQEIKQNLYNQIHCEKGNALYTAIDRYCNLLKPVDANTFLTAFLFDNTMDSYTRLLLCELMKRNLKSINERSLFKKNDDKKRLFIDAICDNKNLLLNSQITVDPSYKAEYKKFSPMIRYDFSESDIKKRIQSL